MYNSIHDIKEEALNHEVAKIKQRNQRVYDQGGKWNNSDI